VPVSGIDPVMNCITRKNADLDATASAVTLVIIGMVFWKRLELSKMFKHTKPMFPRHGIKDVDHIQIHEKPKDQGAS
jgi:hypothetical protein